MNRYKEPLSIKQPSFTSIIKYTCELFCSCDNELSRCTNKHSELGRLPKWV